MVKSRSLPASRVAIVTGAGTGIGRAYALRLAADGMRVLVNNRRREVDADGRGSADRVADEIRAAGGVALANHEDVCAEGAGVRMVAAAVEAWGRLDVLVNNAGVEQHRAFHALDLAGFRAIFDVNFLGTLQPTHAAWAHMRAAGHGRVVVSTSSAGLHGLHGLAAYAASKAALIGLMRTLAAEGASHDIFCNAVAPYAATRMTEPHMRDPAQRELLGPERVAPLVSALVRAESRVNGRTFIAGAGWARLATSVELDDFMAVPVDGASDAFEQRLEGRLDVPGVCREYADGLDSYTGFLERVWVATR